MEVQTVIKLKLIIFLFIFTPRLKVHSVCLLAINVAGNGPFRAPAVYTVLYSCHSEFNKDTV